MQVKKSKRKFVNLRSGIALAALLLIIVAAFVAYRLNADEHNKKETSNTGTIQSSESISNNDATTSENTEPASDSNTNSASRTLPATILDLVNWKLALPVNTSADGNPDEIKQPSLATYTNLDFFHVNVDKTGVVFRANAGGATTSGSKYPRSEMREMTDNGKTEASWSNASSTHTMTITEAITALPAVKSEVVAGQIHDAEDDVIMIRLENNNLFVEADGKNIGELDTDYVLGEKFTVVITANSNGIEVRYNDNKVIKYNQVGSGYYFKAGCYTQSNTSRGDTADAFAEVVIYNLKLTQS